MGQAMCIMKRVTQSELLDRLVAEGFLGLDQVTAIKTHFQSWVSRHGQPWFIKVLQGLGGWLSSIMLVLGTLLLTGGDESGALVMGILMLLGGTVFERSKEASAFVSQIALSAVLVGFGLTIYGLDIPSNAENETVYLMASTTVSVVLCATLRGWVIRALMAFFALISGVFLLIQQTQSHLIGTLMLLMVFGLAMDMMLRENAMHARLKGYLGPLRASFIAFALAGTIVDTGMRTIDTSGAGYSAWVFPIGLTLLFQYVLHQVLSALGLALTRGRSLLHGFSMMVCACLAIAPGIIASVLFMLLATRSRDRPTLGVSIIALVGFGGQFYYQLDYTLLFKALLLALSGGLMLYGGYRIQRISEP